MLSAQSNSCLQEEIKFLRQDLHRLYLELDIHYGVQPYYPWFYNPAVQAMIDKKKYLFSWKKTRLEALEAFAHAQQVITDIEHPQRHTNYQRPSNKPRYQRKRQPKRGNQNYLAICPSNHSNSDSVQNAAQTGVNKKNLGPRKDPSTELNQALTDTTIRNLKIENDSDENISMSIAETLKNLKQEKLDHSESVMNSNINENFVPQLLPADIKVENTDNSLVQNGSRKRKREAERSSSKRAKTQSSSSSAST